MRIYLDVCCLNRPFDDRTQARIRVESEAVIAVLSRIEQGNDVGMYSPMHAFEIGKIRDPERRLLVGLLAKALTDSIVETAEVAIRSTELENVGFHAEDAKHLAYAESANCEVFLTTDDRLEALAKRFVHRIRIRVMNPTTHILENRSK